MSEASTTDDFSALLSDVRQQILYLQELGVSGMTVEMAEFVEVETVTKEVNALSESYLPPKEFYVPEKPLTARTETPKPSGSTLRSRNSLLENSRLSEVSSRLKSIQHEQRSSENQITEKITEMPKKKTEEVSSVSLFGDISQNLPETGETLEAIRAEIGDCRRCKLCEGRTNIAHSTGNIQADLMFIGEAPGADEDLQGKPFVGRAGQLLTKIIEAIGMQRDEVFIGNINRCRPPQNRQPATDEVIACKPFLLREIAVVRPKVIVVLGNTACQNLLETKVGISKLRGNFQDYYGVKVMPTFHPAYLLRDPSKKRETWEDMKKVRDYLNENS